MGNLGNLENLIFHEFKNDHPLAAGTSSRPRWDMVNSNCQVDDAPSWAAVIRETRLIGQRGT